MRARVSMRKRSGVNLLESSLTMLALISYPSVITDASSIDALPRKAAFIAGLGNGRLRLKHEVKQDKHSQVCFHDVLGSPFRRLYPRAPMMCRPPIVIHRGNKRVRVGRHAALSELEGLSPPFVCARLFLIINGDVSP